MIFGKRKEDGYRDLVVSYKKVFGTTEGREVLFDLMNKNYILNGHNGDPLLEGRRSAVLEILKMMHVNMIELDKLLQGDIAG
jgi:hypothetical protein